jgi:hypothetical protein
VILIVSALALAVIVGYAIGGRLRNLEHLRLRWWGLAVGGLLVQLAPFPHGFPHWAAFVVLLASFVMLIAFGILNWRVAGLPVILLGLCLNGLVITVNQGMPVTRAALANSGQESLLGELIRHGGAKHHLADDDDHLVFLSDAIGVPKPIGQAISLGDIFVYVGMIWTVAAAMRGRSRETVMAPQPEPASRRNPAGAPNPPAGPSPPMSPETPPRS